MDSGKKAGDKIMANNKLPAYFEKFMTEKFDVVNAKIEENKKEITNDISDLKLHVNDEIKLIRVAIEKLEKKTTTLTWGLAVVFLILLVHDTIKISIFDVILRLFGVNIPTI